MNYLKPEAISQALGHEGAMTGLGRRLDAQQRPDPVGRQSLHERLQRRMIEYLLPVAPDVLWRETDPRALADALTIVVAILDVSQLGSRSEIRAVLVSDVSVGEQSLETTGVGPHILRSSHSPSLTDVDDLSNHGRIECTDEAGGVELIHTDRRDRGHGLGET